MPGPTGETNELHHRGRGVFVCISPWNFPLAIFLGQVSAALAAGNTVVAKPAEQTPLIAAEAVRLLHAAGIPATALHLVPGDGAVGAALVRDAHVAGIAFTGSTEVAWAINRALAAKDGPIVPLIAETGGINAMIVDATALPEQVTDDVVTSAFRSAGQRCSALRLLCVQEDVADGMIEMIEGAARELSVGDPREISTQVGPVIDDEAKAKLDAWIAEQEKRRRVRFRWDADRALPARGTYVPPTIIALDRASDLKEEVFGPVLHVVRWKAGELDRLLDDIAGEQLRADPRRSLAHRHDGPSCHRADAARQRLCEPQHHRRGGRDAAIRRLGPVRDRPQGGRAQLLAAVHDRAGGYHQHRGRRRQRHIAGRS